MMSVGRSELTSSGVSHGEDTRSSVLQVEVLILELLAVDALTTSALSPISQLLLPCLQEIWYQRTLPRVKSPPWSMNWGITRWKEEPL